MKQQRAKGQRQGEGHWTALTYKLMVEVLYLSQLICTGP